MDSDSDLQLAEFQQAVLRSERTRTLCMLVVLAIFVLLGVFRILIPLKDRVSIGAIILGYSLCYVALEISMLRRVTAAIRNEATFSGALTRMQLILECLFPSLFGVS